MCFGEPQRHRATQSRKKILKGPIAESGLDSPVTTHSRKVVGILGEMLGVTHQLAEERSLALHREVARQLRVRPELLDTARERVRSWLDSGRVSRYWAEAWNEALKGTLGEVIVRITDPSQHARDLRQSSPFAGVLDPRVRWEILRRLREEAVSA